MQKEQKHAFFCIFFVENLVMSEKCSNFAPAFEKKGRLAQLV